MEDNIDLFNNTSRSILRVLSLNLQEDELLRLSLDRSEYVWKILIMDDLSSLSVATIVRLGSLHNHNIAMHLPLHSQREPLPGMTAIYLVEPVVANIDRIIQDVRLYTNMHINFLYPPSASVLEYMAKGLSESNGVSKVERVFKQYLKYTLLEPCLFCLNGPSFEVLERPGHSDTDIENMMFSIAESLFCVLKTCELWPVVYASRGFSELVASALCEMCWKEEDKTSQLDRPLLLIVDRRTDLSSMLHHPWTYQGLVFDVLNNSLNKIVLPGESTTVHELDPIQDEFWRDYSTRNFNEVLQAIDVDFNKWMQQYDSIGQNISSAVERVSEMTQKKAQLDLHMNIASYIVKEAKGRSLDHYNQIEEDLIQGQSGDLLELLNRSPGDGISVESYECDKKRAQIIAFMNRQLGTLTDDSLQRFLDGLRGEVDKQSTLTVLSGLAGKVKDRLLGQELVLPVTKLLHSVLRQKSNDLAYLDTITNNPKMHNRESKNIIVFVVGGGSYSEYHNLLSYGKKTNKNIVYGSTHISSPREFLEQLERLSKY